MQNLQIAIRTINAPHIHNQSKWLLCRFNLPDDYVVPTGGDFKEVWRNIASDVAPYDNSKNVLG